MNEQMEELIQALRDKGFVISDRVSTMKELIIAVESSDSPIGDRGFGDDYDDDDDQGGNSGGQPQLLSAVRRAGGRQVLPSAVRGDLKGPVQRQSLKDWACDGLPAKQKPN